MYDYKNISEYTNISEANIKKYIDKLQELRLIKYKNLGLKCKRDDKQKKISDCCNIYAITYITGEERLDIELDYGLKQQQYWYETNGYKVIKGAVNKNRQINGRKGYLIKQKNNGKITKDQLKELKELQLK